MCFPRSEFIAKPPTQISLVPPRSKVERWLWTHEPQSLICERGEVDRITPSTRSLTDSTNNGKTDPPAFHSNCLTSPVACKTEVLLCRSGRLRWLCLGFQAARCQGNPGAIGLNILKSKGIAHFRSHRFCNRPTPDSNSSAQTA